MKKHHLCRVCNHRVEAQDGLGVETLVAQHAVEHLWAAAGRLKRAAAEVCTVGDLEEEGKPVEIPWKAYRTLREAVRHALEVEVEVNMALGLMGMLKDKGVHDEG